MHIIHTLYVAHNILQTLILEIDDAILPCREATGIDMLYDRCLCALLLYDLLTGMQLCGSVIGGIGNTSRYECHAGCLTGIVTHVEGGTHHLYHTLRTLYREGITRMCHIEESLSAYSHLSVAMKRKRERQGGLGIEPYMRAITQDQVILTAAGDGQLNQFFMMGTIYADGIALRGNTGITQCRTALRQHDDITIGQLQTRLCRRVERYRLLPDNLLLRTVGCLPYLMSRYHAFLLHIMTGDVHKDEEGGHNGSCP